MKVLKTTFAFLLVVFAQVGAGQVVDSAQVSLEEEATNQLELENKRPAKVQFSGYYRFYVFHRFMDEAYEDIFEYNSERVITLFDGYYDPSLQLNVAANPTANTSISTDLFMLAPLGGSNAGNVFLNNLHLNVNGSFTTPYGRFGVRMGGIHWHSISPFTMGTTVIDRYSIWQRNPYEGAGDAVSKYENYFANGVINRDERFTYQAFKGLIVDGSGLPGGLSFNFMYGKNSTNLNNVAVLPDYIPNYMVGGSIRKDFEIGNVAVNTINSYSLSDTVDADASGFNMYTVTHRLDIADVILEGETGFGSYFSPTVDREWGIGVNFIAKFPKKYTGIPIQLQAFHLDKHFVNNIGSFNNTSNTDLLFLGTSADEQSLVLQPFASPINGIGFLANNRQGINLNGEVEVQNLKLNVGLSYSRELERIGDEISFGHRVNGLSISRFYLFSSAVGPYERLGTYWRGAYEVVGLNATADSSANKHFNTLEIQAKYKVDLGKNPIYLFYFGALNSVDAQLEAYPKLNDDPWVVAHYHEMEIYAKVLPRVVLSVYGGWEFIKGNSETTLDIDSGLPIDQKSTAYGVGIDVDLSKNTGLFVRHRWWEHKDENYALDYLKGKETTFEIKLYF